MIDVIVHDNDSKPKAKTSKSKKEKTKNFTLHVEWDGGGEEALLNPEWRMKTDAPDKQGRVSHRDAKVNKLLVVHLLCVFYRPLCHISY